MSGMGAYHGKKSFDTFTHYKGVMERAGIWMFPSAITRIRPGNGGCSSFFEMRV
ncbi:MAG: hypothetical protein ACLR23_09440 [Clostridia bacterium]